MNIASHGGTVESVSEGRVIVKIESLSACAQCEAHGKCGFAESKERLVEIDTPQWQDYHAGQAVNVHVQQSLGFQAIVLAYIFPAIILVCSVILCLQWFSEPVSVLLTLAVLLVYGLVLFICRNKINKKFSFTLTADTETDCSY